jgi:hypothetical protein
VKYAATRPYADPEKAVRKLLEIPNTVKAVQDGRIHIEKINGPFLFREKGTPAEYEAGLDLALPAAAGAITWVKVKNRKHPAFSRVQDQF